MKQGVNVIDKTAVLSYVKNNYDKFQSSLEDFVSIPSVSTDPNHENDIRKAANWLINYFQKIGFTETEIIETDGHPLVYASYKTDLEGAPTVLIYGHYDVQPADPLELWHSDPFVPTKVGDRLTARGASDMKGQIIASIAAVEAILQNSDVPVNIKFIIEGEEEIGSPNLPAALKKHANLFQSDVILNPDAGMISPDSPTIVYGLRGLAYFELTIKGPDHDLHSGLFGGIVHNPAIVLSELIAGMHDKQGKITLPGFYDDVIPLSDQERKDLARLPITDSELLSQTGTKVLWGEAGYTPVERIGARPTLDVNGMYSGFTGKGSKTIIPSWAMAKISMRLVPKQTAEEVRRQLTNYIESNIPEGLEWDLKQFAGGPASMANLSHPGVQALALALESVWGKKPLYKREGGSIPVVADMQQVIGSESVLTGFGLPSDNIHSPNESLHIPTWQKGILAIVHFLYNFAEKHEN